MNEEQAAKIIRLLEEIRDDQRLQLERQATALTRQEEVLSEQRGVLADNRERANNMARRNEEMSKTFENSIKSLRNVKYFSMIGSTVAFLLFAVLLFLFFFVRISH